jgi:hypothetical protein
MIGRVAQLGAHPGPELRALGGLHPDPEDVFDPVQVHPDGQMRGLVADLVPVGDEFPTFTISASR